MSNSLIQDLGAQRLSSDSGQMLPCQPLQLTSDPTASKRVCFYKSGDYKFSGHRMVISVRTFKTFDALLDVLSKKVPLPFGVRTITTPRGTRLVKGLDDLYDGGCYVCSDQRRVKPLNLEEVNRRQVPWNTTRPLSTGRQRRPQFGQFGRRNDVNNRPARTTERVAVRTPKRLTVIKNKDWNIKRTIVLQRRTAPTFDALLDYLSQILQFPVLKLYSMDGRRVDGLSALILCSGVVVAAGNEPFRLGNYSFHRTDQMARATNTEPVEIPKLPPRAQNNKSVSTERGSRNFSVSSERYIVNHIKTSQNGGLKSHLHHHNESFDTEVNQHQVFTDTCGTGRVDNEHHSCILPHDDDIEKSFCVNQDGSMTVEMKVRLTVKDEEMLHWTTTLSRASLCKRTACASFSESRNSSPDSNNAVAKDSSHISEDNTKEENHLSGVAKGVCFNDEQLYKHNASKALGKAKTSFQRTPTPGRHHIQKKASVVKMVTESGVQESRLGHYSYVERSTDGESTERYCVVRQSSSSSNRPIPKPRKTLSAGARNKDSLSFIRSSGVAEVQVENNGIVTETVMHIYENQGCHNNNFSNEGFSADSAPLYDSTAGPDRKPFSETGQCSSRNDIDLSCQSATVDTPQRLKEDMLSMSSESKFLTRDMNNLSGVAENSTYTGANSQIEEPVQKAKTQSEGEKPNGTHKSSASKNSKHSSTDKFSSNDTARKKSLPSLERAKSSQKNKGAEQEVEKRQSKKSIKDEKNLRKDSVLLDNAENVKRSPPKRQSMNKMVAKDNGHNINTPSGRPQMKKNMSGILQPKRSHLPGKKLMTRPKAKTENKMSSPKNSDIVSMPSLNPTPSEIHQYVENWLENLSQEQMTYVETIPDESLPPSKVVFEIGCDSEADEKNGCQTNSAEYYRQSGDAVEKSQEAIGPKAKIKPLLQQLCFFIQCIRKASDTSTTSDLERSNSLPDFSAQVAAVFGSSCKAFLSFLSVMILRENLKNSALGDANQSRSSSEAMLMMQSLHNISAIEDKKEQRASLRDLQSRASSQFRECWKEFQTFREMLEREPPTPKFSETKFATDIVSEVGDIFENHHLSIDELMEELNMPQDLRADITSTIQQARSFYPVEESTSVKTKHNLLDSEKDVEDIIDGAIGTDPDDSCTMQNVTSDLNIGDVLEMGPDVKDTGVSLSEEKAEDVVEDETDEEHDKGGGNEEMERPQEEAHHVKETEQEEVVENTINKVRQRDVVTEHEDEESEKVIEEVDEEEGVEHIIGEADEEGDEIDAVTEEEEEEKYRMVACEEEDEACDAEVSDAGDSAAEDEDCDNMRVEASYVQQNSSRREEANTEHKTKSPTKSSCDGQCESTKGYGTDNEFNEERGIGLPHPLEISQHLLDFVNSALQSSSLTFTYDAAGNIKLESDNAYAVKTKHTLIPKRSQESLYGLRCLPSPSTSDLSDYRPETSESGGYKTQDSEDIVTESEEEATKRPSPVSRQESNGGANVEHAKSTLSLESVEEGLQSESFSSSDSGAEASKEDLSYFSAAGSVRADMGAAVDDGVLIDQGRWLLKENHLIRKSPPVSMGMYGDPDSASTGTGQENTGEDSPLHDKTQHEPLVAISSSELEEMARPQTPKCTYFNMPHGSDSDPFFDDSSVQSGKRDGGSVKGRGFRVSPCIDTAKTGPNKLGSLSSFASVEFKMPDRKVHPEEDSPVVTRQRRTSGGGGNVLQTQESGDTLQLRCGQYCPIL